MKTYFSLLVLILLHHTSSNSMQIREKNLTNIEPNYHRSLFWQYENFERLYQTKLFAPSSSIVVTLRTTYEDDYHSCLFMHIHNPSFKKTNKHFLKTLANYSYNADDFTRNAPILSSELDLFIATPTMYENFEYFLSKEQLTMAENLSNAHAQHVKNKSTTAIIKAKAHVEYAPTIYPIIVQLFASHNSKGTVCSTWASRT